MDEMNQWEQKLHDLMASKNIRLEIENTFDRVDASLYVRNNNGEFELVSQSLDNSNLDDSIDEAFRNYFGNEK